MPAGGGGRCKLRLLGVGEWVMGKPDIDKSNSKIFFLFFFLVTARTLLIQYSIIIYNYKNGDKS